mgnify:CR=1 FL=1|jgi:hypothetical protein
MKKILLPLIILLALYLGYEKLTADVPPETATTAEEPAKDIFVEYVKEPEIPDIDDNPLLGEYSANITNDKLSATVKFEIMANKKIKHYRNVNRDGVIAEGTVEGKYVIDGDQLKFTFPESRDKKVFPMEMLILKVDTNNNISSGKVNFVKS